MSESKPRERSAEASNDPELRAMLALKRYLDPLERSACHRVIRWAEERFVREAIPEWEPDYISKFSASLVQAAQEMGDITPLDIIRAAGEFAKHREARAALDTGDSPAVAAAKEQS